MLQVGNYTTLTIARVTSAGALFNTDQGDVLLPGRLVPIGAGVGTSLEVFVYVDSEERLTATTKRPRAVVGEFAVLKVKEATTVGSFLDWGLEKDLLLPFGEQLEPVRRGDQVLVYVFLHSSGRIAASARLDRFLTPADDSLAEGAAVDLLVYACTDLGAKVVVNNRFNGLLYASELPLKPSLGERLRGFVKKIRDDGKIDVTLRRGGVLDAVADREAVLAALRAQGGFLPLTDKSPPDAIARTLRLSKKSFKKAIGGLYKERLILVQPDGIRLQTVPVREGL